MRPDAVGLGGFDSHTLPPHRFPRATRVVSSLRRAIECLTGLTVTAAVSATLVAVPIPCARAQQVDTARAAARRPPPPTAAGDTIRPISPKRAFLYSLVAPGY